MLSVSDMGPPSPCPAPFNLAAHVLQGGAAQPDRVVLQIVRPAGAERWSHARLEAAVRGAGTGLLDRGLAPGDRVLLRFGNEALFAVAFLGALAAGLVPVPVSAALTGPELSRVLAEIAPRLVLIGADADLPVAPGCPVLTAPDLARMEARPPCAFDLGDPDRLAYMIYTSGTSGRPRAVMHAHRSVWARRMMQAGWTGLGPDDRLMHAGALPWTYTLGVGLLDPWAAGAVAVLPAKGVDPAQFGLLMKRHDVTILAGTPGHLRQMLKTPLPALPRLRHGLSAGEHLPDPVRAAWVAATGTPIHEAFGMSECSTFLSSAPGRPAPEGATGFAQPGRRLALLDGEGAPAPRGAPGTIAIDRRDPGLFLGYFQATEETDARFLGDWFLTGDTGIMSDEGAITYLGRDDDMMNAGGVRVSPLEVEAAMAELPGLGEVAASEVRLKPDVSVIACFYTGAPRPEADLAAHAAARLARYKQPRLFIRVDAIPRGPTHKILRRRLRHDWEAAHGQA